METKKLLFLLAFIMSAFCVTAQVSTQYFENRDAFKAFPKLKQVESKEMASKKMPAFDLKKLLEEDRETKGMTDIPFRFGQGFDVDYTIKDGTWIKQDDKRIWSIKFSSSGAYSLNFIFSELSLTTEAELYIFNTEGTMVYGPITEKANIRKGETFLTDLVTGDEAVIQIIEPTTTKSNSFLRISRVVHGYKNMFSFIETDPGPGNTALACNHNVICDPIWSVESEAVAVMLLANGTAFCSGSLLNNTAQDRKPYFLTAFHCLDAGDDGVLTPAEKADVGNWMFRFRFKSASCNGNTSTGWRSYNHADFRAAYLNTDFALLELRSAISHSANFAGWSRSTTPASSATNIHHPVGDLMKISYTNTSLVDYSSTIHWTGGLYTSPPNSHWRAYLTNGTTEGGSSGSPLFNPDHLVIGQLHGGYIGCAPVYSFYGRFDLSWTGGGTNDTRLSNWLAPNGTNPMTLNRLCPMPDVANISAQFGCDGSYHYGRITSYSQNIDRYEWMCTGTIITHPDGSANMEYVRIINGIGSLYVRAHNGCGSSDWIYVGYLPTCSNSPYSLAVSPNPVSNQLNIEIEAPQFATSSVAPIQQALSIGKALPPAIPQQPVYEVKIFNTATGIMVYQQTMTGTSKQIDVSGLPNGIYTLSVSDGSDNPPMTQQIVVAH